MKKLLTIAGIILVSISQSFAQCNSNYYRFEEGAEFEMTSYNGKDKEQGKSISKITDITENGSAYHAMVNAQIYDKKDKLVHEGEYEVICEDNKIRVNMERFVPSEMLEAYQDMEVEFEGDYLEMPSSLSVGESLPDGSMSMKVKMGGADMNLSDIKINVINRKVEGKESITTPAGTFDCYKITYDTESQMKVMGMGKTRLFKNEEWLAEDIGVVKTASYDDKGKLQHYSLLTAYK